jgi:DNA-binding transcriptional LysR family regulator
MKWKSVAFDWNQVRAVLATIEEGSLSAAARALGQTQPTLSRQVAQLEQELDLVLFHRVGRSVTPTQAALDLFDQFQAMRDAATGISLAASGQSQAIEGHVSITATNFMATYALPPVIKQLRDIAPGISVEIIASNEVQNLMRREADIAIRHARPEQPELIATQVNETSGHLYASAEFLERNGHPQEPADLEALDFIGFEHPERLLPVLHERGIHVTRENFKYVSASGSVILELVREGLGIGLMSKDMAEKDPGLVHVLSDW